MIVETRLIASYGRQNRILPPMTATIDIQGFTQYS